MSTQQFAIVSELHRAMDVDEALSWFNGILSGADWAMRDRIEIVADDGHRTVQIVVWGSRWTLEVDIEESRSLGGVMISVRVLNPADGCELPDFSALARALVP